MSDVFSNGPNRDFVVKVFSDLIGTSSSALLAAPYFTEVRPIIDAARNNTKIHLLIGLNGATRPEAVQAILAESSIAIRYLTHRFHAKIYIFENAALIGSANLTDGGFLSNREAVVCLRDPQDAARIEEAKVLFNDLWNSAKVLTPEAAKQFADAWKNGIARTFDFDAHIEAALGRAEPYSIAVASQKQSRERVFKDQLQRLVYEKYRPAFREVNDILERNNLRRVALRDIGLDNETNRFLNWVRLTHARGDASWRDAPLRSLGERQNLIEAYGQEWKTTSADRVPPDYIAWLHSVEAIFGDKAHIGAVNQDELTKGIMSLHAFTEQARHTRGGQANLAHTFWSLNPNFKHVRSVLQHLIHGSGDFVDRLHDLLYDSRYEILRFKKFCALELYGTLRPDDCPPVNGRMAKALRFLGFDVPPA